MLSLPPDSLAKETSFSAAAPGSEMVARTEVMRSADELVGEAVGTQQEAVALDGDDVPDVDLDGRGRRRGRG